MKPESTLLVVGGGLAGARAAEAARTSGFQGRVVIAGEERFSPYERPPLSKAVLRGEADIKSTSLHDMAFYSDQGIELLTGTRAVEIDVKSRSVNFSDAPAIGFETLVITTGSAPRRLDIPGADLTGVYYLRTADDATILHDAIKNASRVAIIGAGWIGSEVAASARSMGVDVLLIGSDPFPLHNVLGAKVAVVFQQLQIDHDVELRLGVQVVELRGNGSVNQVVLSDGRIEDADVVVVGVGAVPRIELAVAAGLKIENGILVDEFLETSVPGIFAAGDIANAWHPHYQSHLRVEHWANARYQGTTAGSNASGKHEAYDRLPYFYSDQFDVNLEYVGHAQPDDEVVIRGDLNQRKFVAMYHRGGVVSAALTVNVAKVFKELKVIINQAKQMDLHALANPNIPFGELIR
jgi:3-phenylpropionate/trans-cinnamate dioxygenase ferredoxin reductase subunit